MFDESFSSPKRYPICAIPARASWFLKPIPATDILTMLNKSRATEVFGTNFRVSCHKLNENGLVHMHRSLQTFRLSFTLTELGREKAIELSLD